MDYAEARNVFFQPRSADAPAPGSSTWQTPGRVLRDAIEPIATICFWAEPAYQSHSRNGLDFLEGYVWGRSCVLGEPEGLVAASAFGVFEPGLISGLIGSARAKCGLAEVRAAKEAGAIESLRQVLGQPAHLQETISVLRRGVEAADPSGRPMHSGLTALPWPADPLGQLWHACTILREHRGDGHVAAWVAAGLNGLQANILTELVVGWEPSVYTATRGWSPDAIQAALNALGRRGLVAGGALSEEGRLLRDGIEGTTDRLVQPVIDAIGDDLPGLVQTLNGWSQQIIDRGWFPPDPYKQASG